MITDEELAKWEEVTSAATDGPLALGVFDPDMNPVELIRGNLSHGTGPVWLVWCPGHPHSVVSDMDYPEHAVTFAMTGNGPTSEENAEFIVLSRTAMPALIAEVRRLRVCRDELRAALRSIVSVGNDIGDINKTYCRMYEIAGKALWEEQQHDG
jgi:hypothetical protein